MNSVLINVGGIHNAQQKTQLKNALDKIDGVRSIDIDKTLGTVEVSFNAPADEQQIKSCIAETGFGLY